MNYQKENIQDLQFDFEDIIADGNKIAMHMRSKGVENGKQICYNVFAIYRLQDGKIQSVNGLISPKIEF